MADFTRRPFTAEERRRLGASLRSQGSWTSALVPAFFAFGGSLLLCLLVLALFRGYPKALEQGAIALSLIVGAYVFIRTRRSPFVTAQAARLREELAQGQAEVSSYRVADAIEVEEAEDEGLSFYLKLEDGRVLFLSGQYLYEAVERRAFPSARVVVARAAVTRDVLGLEALGDYLPPSGRKPPFTKDQWRSGTVPEDGQVLDVDFESLRPTAP